MKRAVFILIFLIIFTGPVMISYVFKYNDGLKGKIIVVDAGHGGVDSGANNSQILEKDVNLDIALKLRSKLENSRAKVIMTRTEDVELARSKRADRSRYIRDLNARIDIINNSCADMFISIHTNANRNNPSTRGTIVYYCKTNYRSREIAYIFQEVFNESSFQYNGKAYESRHIPQSGNYYLLVNSKIPGVIVETGFITNSTDLMLLKKDEYREYIAGLLLRGILNYLTSPS